LMYLIKVQTYENFGCLRVRHQSLTRGVAWALSEAPSPRIDGMDLSLTLAIVCAHSVTLRERQQLLC